MIILYSILYDAQFSVVDIIMVPPPPRHLSFLFLINIHDCYTIIITIIITREHQI